MVHRQEVKVQTRGPDGGNPTPKRQGRRRHRLQPARERLVEAVGARPFRAKAKRRKAAQAGKLASSSEARSLSVACGGSGDGMAVKSVDLTRGAVQGLRASGRSRGTKDGALMTLQSKDRCAVPEGDRKIAPTAGSTQRGGKASAATVWEEGAEALTDRAECSARRSRRTRPGTYAWLPGFVALSSDKPDETEDQWSQLRSPTRAAIRLTRGTRASSARVIGTGGS